MKLTVVAASGRTGRQVLGRGRHRRGAVRARPRGSAEFGIASFGTRAIVRAMRETGTRRIVVVSVAGIGVLPTPHRPHPPNRDPGVGRFARTVLSPIARPDLAGTMPMSRSWRRSCGRAAWTGRRSGCRCSPNKPATGRYRTAFERSVRGGSRLARGDAAEFMLAALDRPDTIGQAVAIAY